MQKPPPECGAWLVASFRASQAKCQPPKREVFAAAAHTLFFHVQRACSGQHVFILSSIVFQQCEMLIKVKVRHIEHKNPAAMGDRFCDSPNVFDSINKASSACWTVSTLSKCDV